MNYSDLQSNIAIWLQRDDLTARIPTFIELAEASFCRRLKTVDGQVRARATLAGQYLALPDDCKEMRSIEIVGGNTPLEYLTPQQMRGFELSRGVGQPKAYTVEDEQIRFAPFTDDSNTVELVYLARLTPLSGGSPTNWLIDLAPDAYLFGSLVQAEAYIGNDERIALWKAGLEEAIQEVETDGRQRDSGASPQRMRVGNTV